MPDMRMGMPGPRSPNRNGHPRFGGIEMKNNMRYRHLSSRYALSIPLVFAVLVVASLFVIMDDHDDSDATTYGSNMKPYGGMNVHWNELNGGSYYILEGGCPVVISFEGLSMEDLQLSSDESGLDVIKEDSIIFGLLISNVTISLESKRVTLSTSDVIVYGSLPVYYADSGSGSIDDPLTSINTTAGSFTGTYYIKPNSPVSVTKSTIGPITYEMTYVDSGFGLSVSDGSLSGTITKTGTIHATMRFTYQGSADYDVQLIVTEGGTAVSSLSIGGGSSVDMGQVITLSASINPSNATIKDLTWTISNDAGTAIGYIGDDSLTFILVGVYAGNVTVSVTATDGSGVSTSKIVAVSSREITTQTINISDYTNSNSEPIIIDSGVDLVYFDGVYNKDVNSLSMSGPKQFVNINSPGTACRFVFKPVAGIYELTWIHYTNSTLSTTKGTFTVQVLMTITFDANGGKSSTGLTTWTQATGGTMALPSASHDSLKFLGWYDSLTWENKIGMAGEQYTPTSNITLYARWGNPSLVVDSGYTWSGTTGGILNYTPTVKDSVTNASITEFKITIISDATDCLSVDGNSVYGQMINLIPGDYSATIQITKTGYESATQTITIQMPVETLEPITEDVIINQSWSKTLTLKPNDAVISQYTVRLNGETASTSSYSASKSDKTFTITCKTAGVYTIYLTLSATGIQSSTKTLTLNATDPGTHEEPPTLTEIRVTKYVETGSPNTYYLTAVGAANYDTLTWDFGDGYTDSGQQVIHSFKPGVYTVTCTAKNVTTGETASKTTKIETLDKESIDISEIINLGIKYESWFVTEYDNLTFNYTVSDGGNKPTFTFTTTAVSSGYMVKVNGTCNDVDLVGKTITFTFSSGSTKVKEWTATVYSASSADDTGIVPGCQQEKDGMLLKLVNITPNRSSIRLMVDWGDGSACSIGSADGEFSHEYSEKGSYVVSMLWTWTDTTGNAVQREKTINVDITGQSAFYPKITYMPNGGKGTMDEQTGGYEYKLRECGFTNNGRDFCAWSTNPDATKGTTYMPGDTVSPSSDLVLYAIWAAEPDDSSDDTVRYIAMTLSICLVLVIIVRIWL